MLLGGQSSNLPMFNKFYIVFFNDFNNTGEKYDFKPEINWVSSISSYSIGNSII